jgi:thymidylate synthase
MRELNNNYEDELEAGKLTYHMVSAHIYERDFDYVKTFLTGIPHYGSES